MAKLIGVLLFLVAAGASAQTSTIEGFWQDVAGRVLSSRHAAPGSIFGAWHERFLDATYPSAKLIRKSREAYELQDMLYDEREYSVKVLAATPKTIEFVRAQNWSGCRVHHTCRLEGKELFCSIVNTCRERGQDVHDWSGEERYVRRAHCYRDGKQQLQGIPVKCN
jgi:hypothetical protein